MKNLVIFDLDGTLLNTIDDLATAANFTLRRNGYPERQREEYPFLVGNGILKLLERSLPEEVRSSANALKLRPDFLAYYDRHKTEKTHPYEGIEALLQDLRKRGILLAVASNKYQSATEELIRYYFGETTFCVVLGQRENIPVKPDPAIVYDILKFTGIEKKDTLYVGDSGVDMLTAANSAIESVGVTWGFRPETELLENNAVHLACHPNEILGFTGG